MNIQTRKSKLKRIFTIVFLGTILLLPFHLIGAVMIIALIESEWLDRPRTVQTYATKDGFKIRIFREAGEMGTNIYYELYQFDRRIRGPFFLHSRHMSRFDQPFGMLRVKNSGIVAIYCKEDPTKLHLVFDTEHLELLPNGFRKDLGVQESLRLEKKLVLRLKQLQGKTYTID